MVGTLYEHDNTNGRDPICNMKLTVVGLYMQHEVTNCLTLYATWGY